MSKELAKNYALIFVLIVALMFTISFIPLNISSTGFVVGNPSADSFTVFGLLIIIVVLILLVIYLVHRKRKIIMGIEESPKSKCGICGEPTFIKERCIICRKAVCLKHIVKRGEVTYCTEHVDKLVR